MDVLVRNVRPEVHRVLSERAHAHRRSLQSELLEIIDRAASASDVVRKPTRLKLSFARSSGEHSWNRDEIYEDER
ncbi:MAG: hypothetical protein LBC29_03000 [Propionibacteriaceae bacterium]|nr:hypothetical protein [Propionibacteriaceae bacterium]